MDPINPKEEEKYRSSTDESDDDLLSSPSYQDVNITARQPATGAVRDALIDLPTCPPDDVDSNPNIQLPLTPRPTPE
jgi:hypothetical protein